MTTEGLIAPEASDLTRWLPGYEVTELIACGGMGAVYRARQVELERDVAIKVLPRKLSRFKEFKKGFRTEARAMAQLAHPNLVGVYDFGEVEGILYLVMEYVHGASLFQAEDGEAVNAMHAVRIVAGIAEGLGQAHKHGILHRDIKPANILITPELEPKLGDFGLAVPAADVGSGLRMGTPGYMAPEVVRDFRTASTASDVYSLGVILHEMVTGATPTEEAAPKLELVPRLRGLVLLVQKATAREPYMRYADGEEMAKALRKWLVEAEKKPLHVVTVTDSAATPRPPIDAGPAPAEKARRYRRRMLVRAAIIAVLLVAVGIALDAVLGRRAGGNEQSRKDEPEGYVVTQTEGSSNSIAGGEPQPLPPVEPAFDLKGHQSEMRVKLTDVLNKHIEAKRANMDELRSRAGGGEAWTDYFALADAERGRLPRCLGDDAGIVLDESMAKLLNEFAVDAQFDLDEDHARAVRVIHKTSVATMEQEAPDQLPPGAANNLNAWLEWLDRHLFEILDFDPSGIWKSQAEGPQDPEINIMIGPMGNRVRITEGDQVDRGTMTIKSPDRLSLVRESDGRTWRLSPYFPYLVVSDEQGRQLASFARQRTRFDATEEPPPLPPAQAKGRLAELQGEFERGLLGSRERYEQKKGKLDGSYANALEKLEEEYRDDLDTERAIHVRREINRFEGTNALAESDFVEGPDKLLGLQKKYLEGLNTICSPWDAARAAALRAHGSRVFKLKNELTQAGKLDEAMAAMQEVDRVKKELDALSPPERSEEAAPEEAALEETRPELPRRWFGHHLVSDPGLVTQIAQHANCVIDDGWQSYGDALIKAARESRVHVILQFSIRSLAAARGKGIALAKNNPDVVVAMCWESPYYDHASPSDLSQFAKDLKQAVPGIQFWGEFVEKPRGNYQTQPVPSEVDVIVVANYFDATPDAVRRKTDNALPGWVKTAKRRPLLLYWRAWTGQAPGLVASCKPGTMEECAEIARDYRLSGLILGHYGNRRGQVGIETQPDLEEEIREVARRFVRR